MKKRMILIIALTAILPGGLSGRNQESKQKPSIPELAIQGKVPEAVELALKLRGSAETSLLEMMNEADNQITERRISEALTTLDAAAGFLEEYDRASQGKDKLPREALRGRRLRLEGIQLSDQNNFSKAEEVLKQALDLSTTAGDPALEAGIHNNLGYALQHLERLEEAAEQYDTARKMAEEQKDDLRAGSYNFNLGAAYLQLGRLDPAFQAYKRSAEQNKAAGGMKIEARAVLMQGVTLSRINVSSNEPLKLFSEAQALFEKIGDDQNAGWSFYLMGDHLAYLARFQEAATAGEKAVPFLNRANDKAGLLQCYTLLSDMFSRLDNKKKADMYRKLIEEISRPK